MTPADLQRFCADPTQYWSSKNSKRHNIQHPWTRDGYTWATDGHILVRVPAIAEVPDNAEAPATTYLWSKVPAPKRWLEVPETAMPEPADCSYCDRTGKDPQDRRYKCSECNRGKVPSQSSTKVDFAHFANRYLALIQGWEIAPTDERTPAWIRNDDALGLLAPMTPWGCLRR